MTVRPAREIRPSAPGTCGPEPPARLTLDRLEPGDRARTVRVRTAPDRDPGARPDSRVPAGVAQRLSELGFVPGAEVRAVRFAPFGDPMEVELCGYHLSLRKAEAALVEVERLAPLSAPCA
ncbi:MAG: FeoA family protein [Planctomycetota bacterium]